MYNVTKTILNLNWIQWQIYVRDTIYKGCFSQKSTLAFCSSYLHVSISGDRRNNALKIKAMTQVAPGSRPAACQPCWWPQSAIFHGNRQMFKVQSFMAWLNIKQILQHEIVQHETQITVAKSDFIRHAFLDMTGSSCYVWLDPAARLHWAALRIQPYLAYCNFSMEHHMNLLIPYFGIYTKSYSRIFQFWGVWGIQFWNYGPLKIKKVMLIVTCHFHVAPYISNRCRAETKGSHNLKFSGFSFLSHWYLLLYQKWSLEILFLGVNLLVELTWNDPACFADLSGDNSGSKMNLTGPL